MAALDQAGTVVCEPMIRRQPGDPGRNDRFRAGRGGPARRDGGNARPGKQTSRVLETLLPAVRAQELQRQLPGLTSGEGVAETSFGGYRPVVAARRRSRHNRVVADDHPFGTLPVVDVAPSALGPRPPARCREVARQIEAACREHGFFYVTGHGVAPDLLARLTPACTAFFALPQAAKMEIAMARGGPAWRGYFPVGAELTSGQPDLKEGLYFGAELGRDDPRVRAGLPLHGRNLFPRQVPELRAAVLDYIGALTDLGQAVLRGVALSLGLDADYFAAGYTASPTVLFRVFRYPAPPPGDDGWGAGEHTDYGLLTLLAQDANGGLQVRTPPAGSTRRRSRAPSWPTSATCSTG